MEQVGGFYYGNEGKRLHVYGIPDKHAVQAEIDALDVVNKDIVVDWDNPHFDAKGDPYFDVIEVKQWS